MHALRGILEEERLAFVVVKEAFRRLHIDLAGVRRGEALVAVADEVILALVGSTSYLHPACLAGQLTLRAARALLKARKSLIVPLVVWLLESVAWLLLRGLPRPRLLVLDEVAHGLSVLKV